MVALLLVCGGLLLGRAAWLRAHPPAHEEVLVVEVRGEVPAPGFHPLTPPATVHGALVAAGADPAGLVDAALPPGTRVVLEAGAVRLEPMDAQLVVGLPMDLNQAPAAALEAIPGVGPALAGRIVADRRERGPFASVDDLARVRGVGPATVERLRPFVTVE